MEYFWKAAAMILISMILGLTIGQQERDMAILLVLTAVSITAALILRILEPVLDLMRKLEAMGNLQNDLLDNLIRSVGIALAAEIISTLCTDSGFSSLGKSIQLLGSAVILSLSVPLLNTLVVMFRNILGNT